MKAILVFRTDNGELENGIFLDVIERGEDVIIRTPASTCEYRVKAADCLLYVPLEVKGKTYAERQDDTRNKAIEWQYGASFADWAYSEYIEIESFFERNGKRYGLLREFRENAII